MREIRTSGSVEGVCSDARPYSDHSLSTRVRLGSTPDEERWQTELLVAVGQRVQAFQDATDEVDEAVARHLRLNRTDLRCLSVLSRVGAMSASGLADAAGLTRGAMTTALDRIEAAGYVRRVWDQEDRRSVRIEMTDTARREVKALYGPLAKEGFRLLLKYTTQELAAVLRYLEDGRHLQRAHAQRIRGLIDDHGVSARPVRGRRATRPTRVHQQRITSR